MKQENKKYDPFVILLCFNQKIAFRMAVRNCLHNLCIDALVLWSSVVFYCSGSFEPDNIPALEDTQKRNYRWPNENLRFPGITPFILRQGTRMI